MKWICLLLIPAVAFCQVLADKSIRPVSVAGKRALIIGNGTYQYQDRIPQALHDADDMAGTLRALGFVTTVRKDLTLSDLNRDVAAFVRTIQANDLALVYYSGHGGMMDGENYILPVNYERPALPREVDQRAFRMSFLKKDLEDSGARVRVLIFDACRNSSLVGEKSGAGTGLAAMRGQPEGTVIAFASDDGQPARYDPADRNSFYTKALRSQLAQPGVHLKEALERTQLQVFQDTRRTQRPYLYGFLTGPVFLSGAVASVPKPSNLCGDAWAMVKDGRDPAPLQLFLQDFAECGQEVRLARLRMTTLERRADPPPATRPEVVARIDTTSPRTNPKDGLRYVWIPPGTFQMGCSPGDKECFDNETPVRVTLTKGYWLGETEVTQAAYQKVTGNNPSIYYMAKSPVVSVNWGEAQAYCERIGGRLPTEAEWEHAARGGITGARYGELDRVGWYSENSAMHANDVKGKAANVYGLYDMLGNVWEWCGDWYDSKLPGGTDPTGATGGTVRVLRGGSWGFNARYLRASGRRRLAPSERNFLIGLRCAWD